MTIYVDSLFVLNFMINYLILLGSARLAGAQMRRWRMALAAALGGGFAVATVVPGLEFFTAPGMKAFVLALMILAAFGCNRAAVKQGALFLGLSFAFCGVVTVSYTHLSNASSMWLFPVLLQMSRTA